jgi:tRNA 2-thiocytidine biosynthesis protein TtcA
VQVKKMLAEWEREFPGRTETIFSALRNVSPSQLADPATFDFAGLDALRSAALAARDPTGDSDVASAEPWDER